MTIPEKTTRLKGRGLASDLGCLLIYPENWERARWLVVKSARPWVRKAGYCPLRKLIGNQGVRDKGEVGTGFCTSHSDIFRILVTFGGNSHAR